LRDTDTHNSNDAATIPRCLVGASLKFAKYHALGNVYIVIEPDASLIETNEALIKRVCDHNFGVGSDGLLVGPFKSAIADFALRIFNPDGSEAEKSGNGLRIFCRYLWDKRLVSEAEFGVETKGGVVRAQVLGDGGRVRVEMGTVSFSSKDIPVSGRFREVLLEPIEVDNETLTYSAATIGNPHCVVIANEISSSLAKTWGPKLEIHSNFPNRTNVQFVKVLNKNAIQIEIWERGAGYTLASGSSSCAAAAVAYKLGLCNREVSVVMPGGQIDIEIGSDFQVTMTGPVVSICAGEVSKESV
jgi:diaminopimelate epimerase